MTNNASGVLPKKIGRNDLCFCGSGKKYKKCHYQEQPKSQIVYTPEIKFKLANKLSDFLYKQPFFKKMADSKLKELYGDDLKGKIITTEDYELDLFLDVLIYEGKYNDQSPLAYFIKNADLSDWEKEIYTSWLKRSRVTLVEVLRPVDQKSTQLCDLLYKEDIILYDSRLAAQLTPGMVLLGRIAPFNEGWIFSGYLPSPIPPDNAKEMQRVKPGDIKQDDILKHVVTSAAELNFQDLKSANPVEEQKR